MEPVRLEIAPEVSLDYVRSDKFKTGTLSVQLITPINEKTASFGALLPSVLRRGTMSHPDMRSLSTALDLLYGSSIGCTVRKKGENQCIGFAASFIDEEFVPGGEKLLEPMCDLLGELLLDPVTRNGRFLNDYVESEKQNLIDAIRGIINDKRDYADLRLLQEMCRGERYGVDKFGSLARVEKITNQTLSATIRSYSPPRTWSSSTAAAPSASAWRRPSPARLRRFSAGVSCRRSSRRRKTRRRRRARSPSAWM